ncbi:uncharacterized protein LOC113275130 [Papaver somniferum]|uniref:uncharacterized protein LOC113275130 n=1 Tax=Papaver somniferum TaxID=3469 RepID=UPI000E6F6A0B|nr:uncharacterized protein LOC113275130 [Papaver somniferum]
MWKQVEKMFSCGKDPRLNNLDDTYTSFCRSPLHIAVMSGDINFATEILSNRLDLALKQDSNGYTLLHLASVRTSLGMVRLLLKAEPGASMVQDEDRRTPLHLAAMKNHVEIIKELMDEGLPEAIHLRNHRNGETILHFCVKSNTNLKTLKLLVNNILHAAPLQDQNPNPVSINSTDNGGNTILHLAAKMGNMKITNYILLNSSVRIDINVVNNKRLKDLNMLSQAERNDLKFGYIRDYWLYPKILNLSHNTSNGGGKGGQYANVKDFVTALRDIKRSKMEYIYDMAKEGLVLEDFLLSDVSNYSNSGNSSNVGFFPYIILHAGYPILGYTWPTNYMFYLLTNGVAFFVSLTIIYLVICGFMMETSVIQVRILVVLMCISIGCIACGYLSILAAMLPEFYYNVPKVYLALAKIFGVCCLLGVGYFIWSLTWKIVKLRKRMRHRHIGVINYYLKAFFLGIEAKAAGKLILFIAGYSAFRVFAYLYYGDWSDVHPLLF